MKKRLTMFMASALTIGLGADHASAAPAVTVAQRHKITSVPDVVVTRTTSNNQTERHVSSNLGTLVVVGDDAYVTKTDTRDPDPSGWTTFYKIKDFQSASRRTYTYTVKWAHGEKPIDLGHVNGMAYYRSPGTDPYEVGSFYVAMLRRSDPCRNQVVQVNAKGGITRAFKAKLGSQCKPIASITHTGSGNFIVGTPEKINDDDTSTSWRAYYTARINTSGNTDYFELDKKFFIPTTYDFYVGQDIHYDDGDLMIPVWGGKVYDPDAKKTVLVEERRMINRIIEVELGNIVDGTYYQPKRWINLDVSPADASTFEFEGIHNNSNGNIIVGSNIVLSTGKAKDGIHKITAK